MFLTGVHVKDKDCILLIYLIYARESLKNVAEGEDLMSSQLYLNMSFSNQVAAHVNVFLT